MKYSQQTLPRFVVTVATAGKLFATFLAVIGTGVVQGAAAGVVAGRLLVKPAEGMNEVALQHLFATHGATQEGVLNAINVRLLKVPEEKRALVMDALNHNPNIEFAEPDTLFPPATVPNDTYYSLEWHLPKIGAPSAWNTTVGGNNIIIAILDSGVDSTHPDLSSQLVPGWNFIDNNSDASDVDGHGTAVAGTAAAASNDGLGVAAPAWTCKIMPIRISDTNGNGILSAIASGLMYAADHGARIANLSFGASTSLTLSNAALNFQTRGGVLTVSAGNDAFFNPAPDNPYEIVVSATDSADALASWSNTGNNVDVCAPGVNILTTARGGGYGYGTGTSFSAPLVAGVAALVVSANPSLTGAQVRDILKQSADDLGSPGWDPSYGWGRINADKAVLAATGATPTDTTPPASTIAAPLAGGTLSGVATIAVTATDDVGVTKVECYINGALAGSSAIAPATFPWDTAAYANGSYTLQARAYDAAGNVGASATVSVSVQNGVPDLTAPTAQVTSPANGSAVTGVGNIDVSAVDNVGVTKVECYINATLVGTSPTAPATFPWNTATYANGSYTLQARASDAAGNVGASATVSVSVQNPVADTLAPAVRITSPTNGVTVGKSTKVYVLATDNVGVTRVDLLVDGKFYATSALAAPVFSWTTSKLSRGSHTLQAVAYDAAGNTTRSTVVTIKK